MVIYNFISLKSPCIRSLPFHLINVHGYIEGIFLSLDSKSRITIKMTGTVVQVKEGSLYICVFLNM
jgi:hypothetical protein